jgi:hypothetical protein
MTATGHASVGHDDVRANAAPVLATPGSSPDSTGDLNTDPRPTSIRWHGPPRRPVGPRPAATPALPRGQQPAHGSGMPAAAREAGWHGLTAGFPATPASARSPGRSATAVSTRAGRCCHVGAAGIPVTPALAAPQPVRPSPGRQPFRQYSRPRGISKQDVPHSAECRRSADRVGTESERQPGCDGGTQCYQRCRAWPGGTQVRS